MDYNELINKAVASARDFRAQASELIKNGTSASDPEVARLMDASEAALNDVDRLKGMQANEARERAYRAGLDTLEPNPVAPVKLSSGKVDPTSSPEYFAAWKRYMRSFAEPEAFSKADWDLLQAALPASERFALSVTSDSAGGFTVPADRRSELLKQLPAISEFLSVVTVVPTGRSSIEWPRVQANETSGFEDIYTSAGVGSMVGETPGANDGQNEQEFGMLEIPLKRGRYLSKPSLDLVSDSEFDIDSFLLGDAAENMALQRESQCLVGSGIGKNVRGIVYDPDLAAGTDISGTTADHISNTAADLGSAPKIIDWIYAVPAQYRRLPSFRVVINSDSEKRIRKLVNANGDFIWSPGFAGTPNTIEGKPVLISEFMASGGTNANIVGIAGPMSLVIVPVRQNLTPQILLERYADTDQIGLIVRQRFGAGLANPRAFKLAIV